MRIRWTEIKDDNRPNRICEATLPDGRIFQIRKSSMTSAKDFPYVGWHRFGQASGADRCVALSSSVRGVKRGIRRFIDTGLCSGDRKK
jgi:hypothetical protein